MLKGREKEIKKRERKQARWWKRWRTTAESPAEWEKEGKGGRREVEKSPLVILPANCWRTAKSIYWKYLLSGTVSGNKSAREKQVNKSPVNVPTSNGEKWKEKERKKGIINPDSGGVWFTLLGKWWRWTASMCVFLMTSRRLVTAKRLAHRHWRLDWPRCVINTVSVPKWWTAAALIHFDSLSVKLADEQALTSSSSACPSGVCVCACVSPTTANFSVSIVNFYMSHLISTITLIAAIWTLLVSSRFNSSQPVNSLC